MEFERCLVRAAVYAAMLDRISRGVRGFFGPRCVVSLDLAPLIVVFFHGIAYNYEDLARSFSAVFPANFLYFTSDEDMRWQPSLFPPWAQARFHIDIGTALNRDTPPTYHNLIVFFDCTSPPHQDLHGQITIGNHVINFQFTSNTASDSLILSQ